VTLKLTENGKTKRNLTVVALTEEQLKQNLQHRTYTHHSKPWANTRLCL